MRIIKSITVVIMSLFYIGVGVMHFINPKPFLIIIPDYFPNDVHLFLVYVSGFFEILLGFFLLIEKTRFISAFGLILLLLAVFPANIFLYTNDIAREAYGSISQEQALLRMFFQLPLIIIAYWHSQTKSSSMFSYFSIATFCVTIIYFSYILF